jgi:hypothetical protein
MEEKPEWARRGIGLCKFSENLASFCREKK